MSKEAQHVGTMLMYTAVVRNNGKNWSGFFPDLPGTAATGGDKEQLILRLSEVLALHLMDMREDSEDIPAPKNYSDVALAKRYPDSESVQIVEALVNPVSLEIGRVISETGKSLRQLEEEKGIGYSVLSRLQDPFYWGHSLKSLMAFADAFGVKPHIEFVAA